MKEGDCAEVNKLYEVDKRFGISIGDIVMYVRHTQANPKQLDCKVIFSKHQHSTNIHTYTLTQLDFHSIKAATYKALLMENNSDNVEK